MVWEDCYDCGQGYPHVYGPIDRDAVVAVRSYRPGPDGIFGTPDLEGLT